jgi:hypothetical protein
MDTVQTCDGCLNADVAFLRPRMTHSVAPSRRDAHVSTELFTGTFRRNKCCIMFNTVSETILIKAAIALSIRDGKEMCNIS